MKLRKHEIVEMWKGWNNESGNAAEKYSRWLNQLLNEFCFSSPRELCFFHVLVPFDRHSKVKWFTRAPFIRLIQELHVLLTFLLE